jgi:hypothetical protein
MKSQVLTKRWVFRATRLIVVAAVLAHGTIACGTLMPDPPPVPGPLRIPPELRDAPQWSTIHVANTTAFGNVADEDRDTYLQFGPYEAIVERHEFSGVGNWLASGLRGRWARRHAYTFALRNDGHHVWDVRCESRYVEQGGLLLGSSLQLGGSERTSLACVIVAPGDTAATWVLNVEAHSPWWERAGSLRLADASDAECCEITNDQIRQQGRAVAAVRRAWPSVGQVVMAHDLDPDVRLPVAAAVAALLFQRPLHLPADR